MTPTVPFRDITPKESGEYETCARHTSRQTARTLQSAYFCDECAKQLTIEAFNHRPPVFHGETIQGICGLCNDLRAVTMRQWFVCGPCWNVVLAYQKSIAASAAVHEWWNKNIQKDNPYLTFEETEPVYLSPYTRSAKTKLQSAASIEILDFLVSNASNNPPTKLFHIEQKTGPGSIDDMKEFQLDVNDYNDIVGAMNTTRIPSYILHVQASQAYSFPTRKTIVSSMWWTDLFTLQEHQKRIGTRRREDKKAIYYKPTAFQPIAKFSDELASRNYLLLRTKILEPGISFIR